MIARSEGYQPHIDGLRALTVHGVPTLLIGSGPRNPLKEICDREWYNVQPTAPFELQVQRELANARELNRTIAAGLSPQILWLDPLPILCAGGCTNGQVSSS
ncbi:MAG: hypothetical protein ACK575_10050, partial [Cyanobacteriota bacterium]